MESVEKFAAAADNIEGELRFKSGEVWGIPFVFDTMRLGDLKTTRIINELARLEEANEEHDPLGVLRYYDLFYSCFGREQWENIENSLYEIGRGTLSDGIEFFFEALGAAAESEGVELKN